MRFIQLKFHLCLVLPAGQVPLPAYRRASRHPHHTRAVQNVPLHTAINPKVQKYTYSSLKSPRFHHPPDHISCKSVLISKIIAWSDQNVKEENRPVVHQCCSGGVAASVENSPLKPKPSVWRSSAGGKAHFGCRPCCVAALSAPHPGCSLWTLSQKQSAGERKTKSCLRRN